MTKFLKSFVRDEAGAAAAEYALILAIVGAAIALAVIELGDQVETSVVRAGAAVKQANDAAAAAN